MSIKLEYKIVNNPDLSGFKFYVAEGNLFDADAYAEAYGIEVSEIDPQSCHAVEDVTGHLNPGEWVEVDHII